MVYDIDGRSCGELVLELERTVADPTLLRPVTQRHRQLTALSGDAAPRLLPMFNNANMK
jgi:hypothetical protein